MWDRGANLWALVQTVQGITALIRHLGTVRKPEMPTLANTVYFLDACHPARFRSESAKDDLLESLDTSTAAESVKKEARQRIRDGSGELFDHLNGKIRVVLP